MEITIPKQTYAPVGRCIYCGSTENLSREHIVPYGLWGRLVLPEASCPQCSEITGDFESKCLIDLMGGFRARTRVPLRKGRKRNYKLEIKVMGDTGEFELVGLPAEKFPRILTLPQYRLPQIFTGSPVPEQHTLWTRVDQRDMDRILREYKNGQLNAGHYDARLFCRMLAKMAHSYAIAAIAPDIRETFSFFLPDFILNGSNNHFQFVGGDNRTFPPTDLIYEIDICSATKGENEIMFARIRIFACLDTPRYYVAIGQRPLGSSTLVPEPVRL